MAGQVKHTKIFAGGIIPDLTFLSVLKQLTSKNTDGLIGAVANVLRDRGIELMDSTSLLQPLLAGAGVLTTRAPTEEEQKDFEFGYRMADAIAALDIGQTIAVKHLAVVAVEAMEGTDEVIAPRRPPRRPGRAHRQGGEAEAGHAVRRAGRRRRDDPGDARRRRIGAVGGCRQDADDRWRRDCRGGQRGGNRDRGPA